jgi:hypothetical protein
LSRKSAIIIIETKARAIDTIQIVGTGGLGPIAPQSKVNRQLSIDAS